MITASTLLSFVVCEREAWFMHHNIIPDESNPFLELGRFIHERSYKDMGERSIELPGMKIDIMWKEREITIVGEIKKSSRSIKGAKIQLLYYLKALKDRGYDAVGYILIPKERRRIEVKLDEESLETLENTIKNATDVVNSSVPPKAVRNSLCDKCGYLELCWS